MLRIASVRNEHFMELELFDRADEAYASGDVRLSVRVQSNQFAGSTQVWVMRDELRRFAESLRTLNETLQGSARLRSISPKQLDLELMAVSSRGHLAARGAIGHHVYEQERIYWHALEFGFEFEPPQLQVATQVHWLARGAA
jgi:hypothetical protein